MCVLRREQRGGGGRAQVQLRLLLYLLLLYLLLSLLLLLYLVLLLLLLWPPHLAGINVCHDTDVAVLVQSLGACLSWMCVCVQLWKAETYMCVSSHACRESTGWLGSSSVEPSSTTHPPLPTATFSPGSLPAAQATLRSILAGWADCSCLELRATCGQEAVLAA